MARRYRVLDPDGKDHVVEVDGNKVSGHENLGHVIPEDEPNRNEKKAKLLEHLVFAMQAGCKVAGSHWGTYSIESLH